MFFAVLGFIHFLTQTSLLAGSGVVARVPKVEGTANPFRYVAVIIVFAGVAWSLYFLNLKPLLAGRALLNTLKDMSTAGQNTDAILADFDKVFSYNTFGSGEAREQLASYANNVIVSGLPTEAKVAVLNKAVSALETQVAENPEDARAYLFLASLYLRGGRIDDGIKILDKAKELSPQKQQIFFLIADAYITKGDNARAFEILKNIYDLEPASGESAKNLALISVLNGKDKYAEEVLSGVYGKNLIADQNLLAAYARVGNFKKVRDIWALFLEQEPNNAQYHVNLAATYMQLGERQTAIGELQRAIELNPQFKAQGEQFIEEIRAGRNP